MTKTKVSIIAAITQNRAIGMGNKLLWHIPSDLKRFRNITFQHPVIMGRKTFESLGKPLTGRTNIVITRDDTCEDKNCIFCHSLEEAVNIAKNLDSKEVFIIGGGQIYSQAIDIVDKLYLTIVEGNFEADTFFPNYSKFNKVVFKKKGQYKGYKFTFLELIKS